MTLGSYSDRALKRNKKINSISRFRLFICLILAIFLNPLSSQGINQQNQNLILCFVGDTGEVTEVQSIVARALANSDCSFIWHTGDIIYPSGITSSEDPRFKTNFLDPFKEVLDKKIPFILTLGNHDYEQNPSAYLEIAQYNPLIIYPNHYFTKSYGSVCFFALDTTVYDKIYLFYKRKEQISWLISEMDSLKKECKLSIVVAHHPLFSSGDRKKGTPQLSKFLNKYVFGVVDLYISGHNHVLADEGERDGTVQLISGTGSLPGGSPKKVLQGKFNKEIPGYLRMSLNSNDQEITSQYQFIAAKDQRILWSSSKKGEGLRKKIK